MAPGRKKNVTEASLSAPPKGILVPSQDHLVLFQIVAPPLSERVTVEEWGDSSASQPGLEMQQPPVM